VCKGCVWEGGGREVLAAWEGGGGGDTWRTQSMETRRRQQQQRTGWWQLRRSGTGGGAESSRTQLKGDSCSTNVWGHVGIGSCSSKHSPAHQGRQYGAVFSPFPDNSTHELLLLLFPYLC
jgi:hypothetical protein